jgi:hypothetical protein
MDINRLSLGEKIAAAAGVVLLIVMWLNWYGIDQEGAADLSVDELTDVAGFADSLTATEVNLSAWQAFGFIDIILLAAAVAAIGFAVAKAASQSPRLPVPSSAIIAGFGILGTLLVLYRVIDTPYSLDRKPFLFVGLIAVAAIAYGGYRAMQEEGTSFQEVGDNLRDRGGPGAGTGAGPGAGSGGSAGAPPPPPAGGTTTPPPPPPPSSNV